MANRATKFRRHLSKIPLDIRKLKTAPVFNQKTTPDLVTGIAEVVSRVAADARTFTVGNLRASDKFKRLVVVELNKPDPETPGRLSEYDKLVRHPLQALRHAGILREEVSPTRAVVCRVAAPRLLKEVASGEDAAVDFLAECAEKILRDSGLWKSAERFFEKRDERSLQKLLADYLHTVHRCTGIKGKKEPRRMFSKLLNVLAHKKESPGFVRGRLSSAVIVVDDLRYNRLNWRDDSKTRAAPRPSLLGGKNGGRTDIARAKREVKHFHKGRTEIAGARAGQGAAEAHHIFPQEKHSQVAARRENIIVLSHGQHEDWAHPSGTGSLSRGFQLFCLLRKLDAVERCAAKPGCDFYSIGGFVELLIQCGVMNQKDRRVILRKPSSNNGRRDKADIRRMADDLRRKLTSHYADG